MTIDPTPVDGLTVGMLGCGTVGSGVARLLIANADRKIGRAHV